MPPGRPGSLTHGASAYQRGACRCKEICTPAWARRRAERRAAGLDAMNSGPEPLVLADGTTARVKPHVGRIVDAWMVDGATAETVARRMGRTSQWVNRTLARLQAAFDFENRAQLALAIERGEITLEVVE